MGYHEIELLQASINGDSAAFEVIVRNYQSYVCAITYSATGDVEKSEELAQETFIKAWQGLSHLKNLEKFRVWLKIITTNVIRNWFRTKKQDILFKSKQIDENFDVESREYEPERIAIQKEQREVVREALNKIPEKYREPLVLFYRQKQSVDQVAMQLGISEEAAKTRLHRGKQYLRDQVAAMVETTIRETGPGKLFATAVIGSIAALSLKSGTATAATIASAAASETGKIAAFTTFITSTTGKIITGTAAVIIIGIALLLNNLPDKNPAAEPNIPVVINPVANENATTGQDSNNTTIAIAAQPDTQNIDIIDANQNMSDINNVTPEIFLAADEYKFEPRGLVSGLITDVETGEPVIDASIILSVNSLSKSFHARTDEHGFYYFEDTYGYGKSSFNISSVTHVGYYSNLDEPPEINLEQGKQLVQHFKLPKACQIDLYVVDPNGKPVQGADAQVASLNNEKNSPTQSYCGRKNVSDVNGYLRVGGIQPSDGDYLLTVMHHYVVKEKQPDGRISNMRKNDRAAVGKPIRLTNPDIIERVEVVMEKGFDVKGYIQYADGIAGSNLKLYAQPEWWKIFLMGDSILTDKLGFFTMHNIVPGVYNILVFDSDGNRVCQISDYTIPESVNDALNFPMPEKSPQAFAAIEGSIKLTGNNKPLTIDVSLLSSSLKEQSQIIYCDENKSNYNFRIDRVEPGEYSLFFLGSGIYKEILNVAVPGNYPDIELVYKPSPVIEVTVLDAKTGEPVTSYQARVKMTESYQLKNSAQQEKWNYINDENGQTRLGAICPGKYRIQVIADGYAPKWSDDIDTEKLLSTTIKLEQGGEIHGMIVDPNGTPVTGALVIPFSKAKGLQSATQNAFVSNEGAVKTVDGEFLLKDLPEGKETLKILCPPYAISIVSDIQVDKGETTKDIEIVLKNGGTVSGHVYNNLGEPEVKAVLNITIKVNGTKVLVSDGSKIGTVVTDSNGYYTMSGIPEGKCYITRRGMMDLLGVGRRTGILKNDTVTVIDFGDEQTLSGQIKINGSPLANKKLMLTDEDIIYAGEYYNFTQTDSLGNFEFKGVIPGKYKLCYQADITQSDVHRIIEVDISNESLDIGLITEKDIEEPFEIKK